MNIEWCIFGLVSGRCYPCLSVSPVDPAVPSRDGVVRASGAARAGHVADGRRGGPVPAPVPMLRHDCALHVPRADLHPPHPADHHYTVSTARPLMLAHVLTCTQIIGQCFVVCDFNVNISLT